MVARLGDFKQHHFAHEEYHPCPPDEVAQAAAARWIMYSLRRCLDLRQSILVSWPCPVCKGNTGGPLADHPGSDRRAGRSARGCRLLDERFCARRRRFSLTVTRCSLCPAAATLIVVDGRPRRRMHDPPHCSGASDTAGSRPAAAAQLWITSDIPVLRQATRPR
jgi:hypothetical protein